MNKAKRVISFSLILLSVIFFMLSMAGLALTWTYHQRMSVDLLDRLNTIESDLLTAQNDLRTAKSELDSVQRQIGALQTALKTLGIDGAASLQSIADLVGKLEENLVPFISTVAERVDSLRESVNKLKETVETLNQLPLVNIEVPGVEQLEAAATNLDNLYNQIVEGQQKVTDLSQLTQGTVDSLTTGFSDLEQSAKTLSAALGGYDAKISAYLAQIDALQAKLPGWLNIAAISLTVVFIWLGFSQLALFALAWSFYTGQDLLARWR